MRTFFFCLMLFFLMVLIGIVDSMDTIEEMLLWFLLFIIDISLLYFIGKGFPSDYLKDNSAKMED